MAAHLMETHVDSIADIGTVRERLRESRGATAVAAAQVATMNFVVFIDDPAHRAWVLERAAIVAEKHPSRLIVLDSTDATAGIDVSSKTRERGGATVVNERVAIGVNPLAHDAIVSLVQELAVPDIPTVLWWTGVKLLASRTFSGLAAMAATVVVDSSGRARDEETLRELCTFAERFPNVILHDLAFMRLMPWQDIIAQFFDDPTLREDLFSLVGLEIESGSEAEAIYLAGWLGSRLSWNVRTRGAFTDGRGTAIAFGTQAKGDRRRVQSVVLRAHTSAYRAEISSDDENVVCLSVSGAHEQRMGCVPLHDIENTTLIERAILENARDLIFDTSLETVRALLG
jgi:glucose-6-phosphate dehydrogenase assembly protein OpcA